MTPDDIMTTASHYSEVDHAGYVRFTEDDLINFVNAITEARETSANVAQGAEAVAWLHTLHMEGDQTDEIVTRDDDDPFGIRGEDYDPSYWVTSEPLCRLAAPPAQTALTGGVLTYRNQPDNVGAWRLGEACRKAADLPAGDYIDRGLGLLKELQAKGYGVIALTAESEAANG